MKLIPFAALSASCLLLASCVPKWDGSQKAALSSVAVPAPIIAKSAYKNPVGKVVQSAGSAPVVPVQGAGFAAGAVGNGIAQLIVEGIGAAQQSMYDNANADSISRVSRTVPANLSERIRKGVAMELGAHSFFAGKVRDVSANRLVVKVDSYGFVRTTKVEGKILMAPQIVGSFELIDGGGKPLLKQPVVGFSTDKGHALEDFANNPKLTSEAFDAAINILAAQITAAIDLKAK